MQEEQRKILQKAWIFKFHNSLVSHTWSTSKVGERSLSVKRGKMISMQVGFFNFYFSFSRQLRDLSLLIMIYFHYRSGENLMHNYNIMFNIQNVSRILIILVVLIDVCRTRCSSCHVYFMFHLKFNIAFYVQSIISSFQRWVIILYHDFLYRLFSGIFLLIFQFMLYSAWAMIYCSIILLSWWCFIIRLSWDIFLMQN